MPGTRVAAQLKQLLRTTDTSELHSNENDSTGRYWPTPQEKARSCGYNWADCQLYERLSGHKYQFTRSWWTGLSRRATPEVPIH